MEKNFSVCFLILSFAFLNSATGAVPFIREQILDHAKTLSYKHEYQKSKKLYEELLKKHPEDLEALYGLATLDAWSGQHDEAARIYKHILKKNPKYLEAQLGYCRLLYWRGEFNEGCRALSVLEGFYPGSLEMLDLKKRIEYAIDYENIYLLKLTGHYEHFSFFDQDGYGGGLLFAYDRIKKWGLRLGGYGLNKFSDPSFQVQAGGTYWLSDSSVLTVDTSFAPRSTIFPKQSYQLEFSKLLGKGWKPSTGFRFSNYSNSNAYFWIPAISWQLNREVELFARSFLVWTQFFPSSLHEGNNLVTAAIFSGLYYTPFNWLSASCGYSYGKESFDPGNQRMPGLFVSQHAVLGLKGWIKEDFGVEITFNQEWRDNGFLVTMVDFGISHQW